MLWRRHRALVLIASGLLAIAAAVVIVWPITDLIAAHDVGAIAGAQRALQLQTARAAVRTQLLTLGAGVFAAGALVFTARNSIFAQRTVQLTEQGQVTDRYTKAIEQLGSDKPDVRIGGIYALERIALDSARDHPTVMEVLAAFIREHSREQWPLPEPGGAAAPERRTRSDVQTALTVIGRRNATHDRLRPDLKGVELFHADLRGADLSGVDLRGAQLDHAFLHRAHLDGADLSGASLKGTHLLLAHLTGADLSNAELGGAVFSGADLRGANFRSAQLSGAQFGDAYLVTGGSIRRQGPTGQARLDGAEFWDADLTSASFGGVDLRGAKLAQVNLTRAWLMDANLTDVDLTDVKLTRAYLVGADLTGAKFNGALPRGWQRDPETGRLRRSGEQQKSQPGAGVDGAS
jgi:uncharacterized protein YjbI with pentapeptide repeats